MKDDDLEKLLQDVDGDTDYEGPGEEIRQSGQHIARMGDTEAEESKVLIDPAAALIEKINNIAVDEDILVFKSGILDVIDKHYENANVLMKMISDTSVSESVDDILKKYRYTFTRYINKIIEIYEQHGKVLSDDSLSAEAKRSFNHFFDDGLEDDNRIDFLVLKEIFMRLQEFNSAAKGEWKEFHKSIGVMNLTAEGKPLYLEMNGIIQGVLDFCANTEGFLQRIRVILGMSGDDFDVLENDIKDRITYYDALSYRYADIFMRQEPQADFKAPDQSIVDDVEVEEEIELESQQIDEMPEEDYVLKDARGDEPVDREPQDYPEAVEDSFSPAIKFTVRGTRSWNTRVPYIIRMHSKKLERDYSDLSNSFIFLDDSDAGSDLEGGIRIAMLKFLRDRTQNIIEGYQGFIYQTIDIHLRGIGDYFKFEGEKLKLFTFHLGPFSMYRILINRFQDQKIGYCYKHLGGNRVSKFIPFEFIKETVLNWFEQNINGCDLQFDRIQEFDEFRRTVSKRYYSELDRITKVIDEVIKKSNLEYKTNINKFELFKGKWNQWFGLANIVIYKRFIEKTIF
jgi:hypothetical protein